jgi:hypothetical protein
MGILGCTKSALFRPKKSALLRNVEELQCALVIRCDRFSSLLLARPCAFAAAGGSARIPVSLEPTSRPWGEGPLRMRSPYFQPIHTDPLLLFLFCRHCVGIAAAAILLLLSSMQPFSARFLPHYLRFLPHCPRALISSPLLISQQPYPSPHHAPSSRLSLSRPLLTPYPRHTL